MDSKTLYDAAIEKYGHVYAASYFSGLILALLEELPDDAKKTWIKLLSDQFNIPKA